jgi:hypothetical protein
MAKRTAPKKRPAKKELTFLEKAFMTPAAIQAHQDSGKTRSPRAQELHDAITKKKKKKQKQK